MPFLLDTHAYLWFIGGDDQLPVSIRKQLENTANPCYISIASFWEIAIKLQLKKLSLEIDFEELFSFAERNQIEIIPINRIHLSTLMDLQFLHNDPFDRVIIAQALAEGLTLVSKDRKIGKYAVKQIWD